MRVDHRCFSSLLVWVTVLVLGGESWAVGLGSMTFHGWLTTEAASPVSMQSDVKLSLSDQPPPATALWSNRYDSVVIADGYFTVDMGTVDQARKLAQKKAPWFLTISIRGVLENTYVVQPLGADEFLLANMPGLVARDSTKDKYRLRARIAVEDSFIPAGANELMKYARPDTIPGQNATIDGARDNTSSGKNSAVSGGKDNHADANESTVGGGTGNFVIKDWWTTGAVPLLGCDPKVIHYGLDSNRVGGVIGGGRGNLVLARRGTIGGGEENLASGAYSTVAGGFRNKIYEDFGSIGGGDSNVICKDHSVISGGHGNRAEGRCISMGGGAGNKATDDFATVAGGLACAAGPYASVSGGVLNVSRGTYSCVPGGGLNSAGGAGSFAAGIGAWANNDNCFVWSDGNTGLFESTRQNQFLIHASGGVGIGTNDPGSYQLAVEGKIGAREIIVTATNPWPDYVFDPRHNLLSINELEGYVRREHRLPNVPSGDSVAANGIKIGEMNTVLLQKIEELTLYIVELNNRNQALAQRVTTLEQQGVDRRGEGGGR